MAQRETSIIKALARGENVVLVQRLPGESVTDMFRRFRELLLEQAEEIRSERPGRDDATGTTT
jgi:hypothetical protein